MFQSFFLNRRWFAWSLAGTALILFATWYKVMLDVQINEWFGDGETISRETMVEIAEDLKIVYRSQLSAMNNDETGEQYDPTPEKQ